mmetsp:Transcript_6121/g.13227  ORF Transcript_6121/g.13227 Transcript_6121/m.13227 type:complete len:282 (-) Transcript_6121:667-1512(-)
MVSEIVFGRSYLRVNGLEVFDTSQLEILGLLLGHDGFLLARGHTQFGEHLGDLLDRRMLVGTAVVFVGVRGVAVDDLRARVRGIGLAFSFLSVHVTKIVGILLVEILTDKHAFEIRKGVIQGQSRSLQEQTVLQASPVLQVLFFSEGHLQLRHAQRHVLQMGRDVVGGQLEAVFGSVAAVILLLGVHRGNVLQKARGSLERRSGWDGTQECQLPREIGAKPGRHQVEQFGFRDVGLARLDKDLSVLDQIQCLRKGNAVDGLHVVVLVTGIDRQWILVQAGC